MGDRPTDAELVLAVRAGESGAYGELARRWAPRVLALCHARLGRAAAAEDLAQEALLRGLRSVDTLRDPDRFGSWLLGIAVFVCLDHLKSRQRQQVSLGGREAYLADPAPSEPDRDEDVERLMAAVEDLPYKLREVLMIYYYEDVTYQDVADRLGISPATVNARLTRARRALRVTMAGRRA